MLFRLSGILLLLLFSTCQNGRDLQVLFRTNMGDIRVRLYDQTPRHRDNFLAVVESRPDSLMFYRVERDFTIQFGQQSADKMSQHTGVAAEIKTLPIGGALAAVAVEPGKVSDGANFFLVLDRPQTDASLDEIEKKRNLKFTPAERRAYKKCGGLPELQGQVTVFGEIVAGLEVAQRIAAVPRDANGRPLRDIPVRVEVLR